MAMIEEECYISSQTSKRSGNVSHIVCRYFRDVQIILKKNDSTLRPHRTGKRLLKKPPQLMYALLLHDRVIADDTISSASEDKVRRLSLHRSPSDGRTLHSVCFL